MAQDWYVIHTYSGHENKVKLALENKVKNLKLQDKILEVFIPTSEVEEKKKDGKKKVKSRKIFPGYVLVKMDIDDESSWSEIWSVVKNIPGVTNFLGDFNTKNKKNFKPKPLSQGEKDYLEENLKDGKKGIKETVTVVMDFSIGDPVRVIEGPFNNFTGVVEEIYHDKGRLRVKVEIFGRGTPVELDFSQVGKI